MSFQQPPPSRGFRRAVGLLAAPVLLAFDYLIVAAAFLGRPWLGELVLSALAGVILLAAAIRLAWLVPVSQNLFLVAVTTYAAFSAPSLDVSGTLQVVIAFVACNLLAWPAAWIATPCGVARAGPVPSPAVF